MRVRVEKHKDDKEQRQGLSRMLGSGWDVQRQSARKRAYSLATGVFTKNHVRTVTYTKASGDGMGRT